MSEEKEYKRFRMNNYYHIVDRNGNSIHFKMNDVQEDVFNNLHQRNLILKARQLGMSTFSVIYILDEILYNPNISAGIVSYSLEHAQHIFKKIIGYALDTHKHKKRIGIVSQSAREISFSNGSSLRVDTTLRGGAYQLVLVSEFGKTCARSPQKAEEVITGTLNTLSQSGVAIIESTGEGNEGFFAEMCNSANLRGNDNLNSLDYCLFFYPWYKETSYAIESKVSFSIDLEDYFNRVEKENSIKLSLHQRYWYASQYKLLGEKIKQEFPSTVSEAFLSSSDAYYFSQQIEQAYQTHRCLTTSLYDALLPVYVSLDIGVNDLTVMIFFQITHGEVRIIDYYEDKNKGVDFYAKFLLQDKRYLYNTIYLPHDASHRDGIVVENTYEREFKKLFAHTSTKFHVLKRNDKQIQISNAKIKFERCVFNISKTKPLIDMLSKYRKKWSEQYGRYLDEPYHGIESNYADAFIYAMQAVNHIETVSNMSGSLEKHRKVIENRKKMI